MKIVARSADRETILQCGHTFGKFEEEYEVSAEQLAWFQQYRGVVVVSVLDEAAPAKEPAAKRAKA